MGLGVLQILAGIIFFFAANWSLLSKWERLGPLFALLVACGVVAWLRHESLVGKLCLFAATVLVGAFMAVFGQIYQTGADAWTLFASWSALTVAGLRFAILAADSILMVVFQTAIVTYMSQALGAAGREATLVCALVCLVAIGGLMWRSETAPRWFHRFLAVNCAVMLMPPSVETTEGMLLTSALILVVLVGWARRAVKDLFLPAVALSLAVFLVSKFLIDDLGLEHVLLIGIIITIQVALVTAWLRRQWARGSE